MENNDPRLIAFVEQLRQRLQSVKNVRQLAEKEEEKGGVIDSAFLKGEEQQLELIIKNFIKFFNLNENNSVIESQIKTLDNGVKIVTEKDCYYVILPNGIRMKASRRNKIENIISYYTKVVK